MGSGFSDGDRRQLESHGIPLDEAEAQLAALRDPPAPLELVAPCHAGDGILTLDEAEQRRLERRWGDAASAGRASKLVPASGAATRMFRSLVGLLAEHPFPDRAELERRATDGDPAARDVGRLIDSVGELALVEPLRRHLADRHLDLDALLEDRAAEPLLGALLGPHGLDMSSLPKALVPFHRRPSDPRGYRTALEEHLSEATLYVADLEGDCRVELTIQQAHEARFRAAVEDARDRVGGETGCDFAVRLTTQSPATDTVAIDDEGRPFRRDDGSLLLRPGGHGALIRNLAACGGDLVFIKNVDNVMPPDGQRLVAHWQRVIGGLAVELEAEAHRHLDALDDDSPGSLDAAAAFLADRLADPEITARRAEGALSRELVARRLDRPLRVCGAVPNRGEPGGGPFLVRSADGELSRQIVETAQIADDPGQLAILAAATHFNPVQMVCALHDRDGRPRELANHVDPTAGLVTAKTDEGRPLLALERPGLWNGAMADWNTLFVELPLAVFAPVKAVFDLLRPEHQARG